MQRSDALRNRERILEAARDYFARFGCDGPLEDIAAAAEITRTSLSRHFPTRQDLAAAVYEENVGMIERRSAELADRPSGILKLTDFVWTMSAENENLLDYFIRVGEQDWLTALGDRVQATFAPHLDAGRAAGVVRPDVSGDDVIATMFMVRGVDALDGSALKRRKQLLRRTVFSDLP